MQDLKEISSYRASLREKIMDTAMTAFIQHGIRAVKMDDIAQQLGISKRTLYEIYEDKEELLYQSMRKYDQRRVETLTSYAAQGHHVIDIILEAYRMKVTETRMVNPLFYADIMKYPKVEQYIKNARENSHDKFITFLQRGVTEGFFREDLHQELIPHLMDAMGKYIMSNQLLQRYSAEELFANFFLVTLRGICTERGVQTLDAAIAKIL